MTFRAFLAVNHLAAGGLFFGIDAVFCRSRHRRQRAQENCEKENQRENCSGHRLRVEAITDTTSEGRYIMFACLWARACGAHGTVCPTGIGLLGPVTRDLIVKPYQIIADTPSPGHARTSGHEFSVTRTDPRYERQVADSATWDMPDHRRRTTVNLSRSISLWPALRIKYVRLV